MAVRVLQPQLERACGGAAKLLQLIDFEQTGDLGSASCQDFINEVLGEGNGDVNGYIGLAVDLNDTTLDTAPMLIRLELAIDVYLVWLKGTGGVAIPDRIQSEYDKAIGDLGMIRDRKMGIGLAVRPSSAQDVAQVTKTDDEPYFSTASPRRRFNGWA